MKKYLLLFIAAVFCMHMHAQTVIGRQNVDQFPVNSGGTLTYGLTWLPSSYASSPSKKYPLIIFLHGSGEAGTTINDLNKLINQSPPALPERISNGFNAIAVNPKDGQPYEFIVCSPQAPSWSYNYDQLKYILPNILSRYRVDTTRIYLTGLSAGGGGIFDVLGSGDSVMIKQFAAVVTVASAGVDAVNNLTDLQVLANLRQAAKYHVAVWTIAGGIDDKYNTDLQYHDSVNITLPTPRNKLTMIDNVGHWSWKFAYDTTFRPKVNYYSNTANVTCHDGCAAFTTDSVSAFPRGTGVTQDSLNLYEWLLINQRSATQSGTPTANAGPNQSIILPANSVTLSGSGTAGAGHTISSYGWTKVSGGAATITTPSSATTTVTGLVQGTYVFRLTVTNNVSATATSDVTITVNPAPVANAGNNQTITLPTNSVTLDGSGSTGTITSYAWSKVSGGAATITSPSNVTTTVTGLVQGPYVFQLSLNGGTSTSNVTITVNASANLIGNQYIDSFPSNGSGGQVFGLTWLPITYGDSASKKYPLVIFLHNNSQAGSGHAGLNTLITDALPQKIANGLQPAAINPLTGVKYEFIVVSPQDPSWTPNYNSVKYILPNIISRYRIDTSRIYITGAGTGGDGTLTCIANDDTTFIKKFAAAATSSSIGVDGVGGLTDVQVEARMRNAAKKYGVQVWTVTGDQDGDLDVDVRYHDSLNVASPAVPNKLTVISGIGHSSWSKQYDTAFRPTLAYYGSTVTCNNGCASITAPNTNGSPVRGSGKTQDSLNLFEWFLLYQRTVTTPTANAGNDQTITLPTSSVTLTGSGTAGAGHTISSYGWTKVSGGSATITTPSSASTTVTGLTQGSYTFRLTVTNNVSATATSDVHITVNASGSYASPTISASGNQSITATTANVTSSYTITGSTLSSITWTKFSVPGQAKKKVGILGSSTSAGSGATTYDSAYAGRLLNYYKNAGIIDSVINLAVSGYNPYQAMPTGYTPPQDVTNKLSPSDVPDPAKNVTALLTHHPDVVIVNFPTNGYDVLTMSEIMTALQTIYNTVTATGAECYITTSQPRMDQQFNQSAQNFLQVVRDSILNRFGAHAINFYDAVAVPGTTNQIPAYMYGDSIHLNNAGHLQLFNKVVGTNIFKNLISSSASITAPTTQNTSITNLPLGVSKFQVTVVDGHQQSASAVTSITVNSTCGGTKHIISPDPVDSSVYITSTTSPSTNSFAPGDTLVLNSAYSSVDLQGIHGTNACPVVIINQTVQALITKRLNLDGCTNVKVTGSGTAAQYGIFIQQDPQLRQQSYHAIGISDRSKNIEVEKVFMHNVDIGIVCETNEDCADSLNYPNWILDSMYFHDNKIVGTWNEGMYIGNTSPDNASYDLRGIDCGHGLIYPAPMKNGYTKIYNNIVDSTGRGGIQLANAAYGVSEIYNNTVKHNGLNGDDGQGTAISVGLYTRAYIHDNTVSNTYTWGIASLGAGATNIPLRIENNTIDSSGYLTHYDLATTQRIVYDPRTETTYTDALTWPQSIEVDTRPRFYVGDPNNPGTAVPGQDSTQFWIKNNHIGKKKSDTAINVEDHYPGMQKSGNFICGNVNISNGSAAVINVLNNVNYSTNCSGNSSNTLVAGEVSAENSQAKFVKIFPNPSINDNFIIAANNEAMGKVKVSVYDINGRLIQQNVFVKTNSFFQQQLYLQPSAKGMYLVKIEFASKEKPSVFKLIRQ